MSQKKSEKSLLCPLQNLIFLGRFKLFYRMVSSVKRWVFIQEASATDSHIVLQHCIDTLFHTTIMIFEPGKKSEHYHLRIMYSLPPGPYHVDIFKWNE